MQAEGPAEAPPEGSQPSPRHFHEFRIMHIMFIQLQWTGVSPRLASPAYPVSRIRIRSASGRIGLCVAGSSRSSGQSPGQVPQRASRRVSVQRRGLVVCRQQDQSGEVTTSDCLDQPGGSQSRLSRCQSSGNRLKPEAALRDPCGHHCREPGLDMQQGIPCPEPGDAARARPRAADPALMSIRAAAVRRCSRTVNYRR